MRFLSSISFGWLTVGLALGNAHCGGLSRGDASGQNGNTTGASGQAGTSGSRGGAAGSGAAVLSGAPSDAAGGLAAAGSGAAGTDAGASGAPSGCSNGAASGRGATSGYGSSGGGAPLVHRPVATACAPTSVASDAGTLACTVDTDCQGDAGTRLWCLHGTCQVDQCIADSDCVVATACGCAGSLTGLGANACVASGCRVDQDCGACGQCSPTAALCGPFHGYQCRTATDSCATDVDCMPNQNDSNYVWCDYAGPATGGGQWSCMDRIQTIGQPLCSP
jgi:hypothetical protein